MGNIIEYGIRGIWIKAFGENGLFRGSFEHYKKEKKLEGRLRDYFGHSTIKGDFEKNKLSFEKTYDNRKGEPILYEFEKQRGIWVGKFTYVNEKIFGGETSCELSNDGNYKFDWEEIVRHAGLSPQGAEEYSRGILEYMIQTGFLIKTQDAETGENLISLTEKGEKIAQDFDELESAIKNSGTPDDEIPF